MSKQTVSYLQNKFITGYVPTQQDFTDLFNSFLSLYGGSVGDGTNQLTIEADGTIRFDGAATVFDDINISVSSMASTGASILDVVTIGSNKVKGFIGTGNTTQQADGTLEILHPYKEGSSIVPHFHWMSNSAAAGNVKLNLGYRWWNKDGTMPAETVVSFTQAMPGVQYQSGKNDFVTISGAGMQYGSRFMYRIFRDPADVADTYTDYLLALDFGIHYEKDTCGSRTISTK